MTDLVDLLKKTIEAQVSSNFEIRQRIYDRARETVEKKLQTSSVAPEFMSLQRKIIEKAIDEVEEFYMASTELSDVFSEMIQVKEPFFPEVIPEKSYGAENSFAIADTAEYMQSEPDFLKQSFPKREFNPPVELSGLGRLFSVHPEETPAGGLATASAGNKMGGEASWAHFLDQDSAEDAPQSHDYKVFDPFFSAHADQNERMYPSGHPEDREMFFLDREEDRGDAIIFAKDDFLTKNIDPIFFEDAAFSSDQDPTNFPDFIGKISTREEVSAPDLTQFDIRQLKEVATDTIAHKEGGVSDPAIFAPEREKGETKREEIKADFSPVSGMFSQTMLREQQRLSKRRFYIAGIVISVLLCIIALIFWFLTDFLHLKEEHSASATVGVQDQLLETQNSASRKIEQRLLPNGQEIDLKTSAEQRTAGGLFGKLSSSPSMKQNGEVVFREAGSALFPASIAKGTVHWSILHEKEQDKTSEGSILQGDIVIPDRDIIIRMTIKRNQDASIAATHFFEFVFVVPENFSGGNVDKVGRLLFKAAEESIGQELRGLVPLKIKDNLFVFAMNSPESSLNRNLNIIRQLPWIGLEFSYKNGRIAEVSFSKGEEGTALFKQIMGS